MKLKDNIKLPRVLSAYQDEDYTTKQKVNFIFYLTAFAILGMAILSVSSSIVQIHTQEYGKVHLPVLIPMLIGLVLFVISLIILIKGKFRQAAQLFILVATVCVWYIMWIETGNIIVKTNTVVIVVAILSLFPLYVANSKKTILVFTLLNVITLILFVITNLAKFNVPIAVIFDYVSDTSIAFIFTGVIGYYIYKIHSKSLELVKRDYQERIKVENDLKESELKLGNIFENAQIGIYQTTPNGEILQANPALIKMLGYDSLDDLNQRNLESDDVYVNSDRNRFIELIEKHESLKNYESVWYTKEGEQIIVKENSRVVRNTKGTVLYYEGFVENVTERRLAEKKLKESNQLFQTLAQASPVGIFRTRPDGYTTYVNPKWTELSGMSFEQAQGDDWLQAVHPDDIETLKQNWKARSSKGVQSVAEYRFVKPDGSITWVLGNAIPEIVDNKLKGYVGTITDITELKITESKLKESEDKYKTIIDAFPDIIMISDLNSNIIFGNDVLEEITGISKQDYNNPNRKPQIHPEDRNKVQDAIDQLLKSDEKHTGLIENRFIDKWDKEHWFRGIISKIVLNGEIYLQTITRDITDKKYMEQELEKHQNHLEMLVKERTEELAATNEELLSTNEELQSQREELEVTLRNLRSTQQQLIHAEKMASLGVLASGIAHEINNPLNFIRGGAFAIEQYLEEKFKANLQDLSPLLEGINEGVDRAAEIVSSLKHYSYDNPIKKSTCSINAVIENCLTMLRNQIDSRITLVRKFDDQLPKIKSNEGKLHQVILNILLNAAQAIEHKGTIKISTLYNNQTIFILISDTGSGISKENLSKIFDPFFTTKEAGKGTGLGLSITFNIIEDLGGLISVNSELGKGTDVEIKIPLKP